MKLDQEDKESIIMGDTNCNAVKGLNPGVIWKVEFDRPGERSPE